MTLLKVIRFECMLQAFHCVSSDLVKAELCDLSGTTFSTIGTNQ